ncbi:MAG: DAK2 domain-containing protein, partial [Clostridia bacterium]|nr:DAK2 domain-containing protein [Clostridia bacterium]
MFKGKKNKASGEKKDSKKNKYLGGLLLSKMAVGGAELLSSNADEVNKLNVFPVPDGDTGDNMRMTIESGIAALEKIDSDDLAKVMKTLSRGMLLGARGNSGVILSQFFAGMAKGLDGVEKADAVTLGKALETGVKQAYASVMTPTEGTILTVAREAVEYAVAHTTEQSTIKSFFADLVKEMHESLDRTPEILTVLKEAGVVDSGGAGLLYIIEGFNRVLNGEVIEQKTTVSTAKAVSNVDTTGFGPDSEMTYGYCTELLVQLQNKKTDIENFDIEPLKAFLCEIGDSVVAFKTESIVKLHVHTFTPEKVLEYCRQYGEFLTVKIENMSLQHSSTIENKEDKETAIEKTEDTATETAAQKPDNTPAKKYGIVAVCSGDGIESLYKELGTDEVVQGGQTQNPSTNDFLDAFAKVNAEHIFVFPNNGNIFMAAQQAGELYKHATVHVIPSKNIGPGYVAVSS